MFHDRCRTQKFYDFEGRLVMEIHEDSWGIDRQDAQKLNAYAQKHVRLWV